MAKYLDEQGVKTLWSKTKEKINSAVSGKANSSDVYTKSEVDTKLSSKANTSDVYTKTDVDSKLSGKANSSHTHSISDITNLQKSLDAKANASDLANYITTSAKGQSNGVATLDSSGKVPSAQLPSYVDDVLEYTAKSSFPQTGETGKIYVDTTTNKTYRWSGTSYVEISASIALGETSSTAYAGDKGKKNADDISQLQYNLERVENDNVKRYSSGGNTYAQITNENGTAEVKSSYEASSYNYTSKVKVSDGTISFEANKSPVDDGDTVNNKVTLNDDGFKFNDNQLLDSSMALSTEELNAILV